MSLSNSYQKLPKSFYEFQKPTPVKDPVLVCFNHQLNRELGLDISESEKILAQVLSGNELMEGSQPISQAYAGHQFGHFTMLGDGRATLLGEHLSSKKELFDIQLKGSGETPFSRRGDGKATLYSMLREYLISEAMHHLGIPTTRSLAVVATGEKIYRQGFQDSAVLTRIAKSHIRVGTFEYARNFCSIGDLKSLLDYTISRHYPQIKNDDNPALAFLNEVMSKQIDLVINWIRVGFIHGVMNTDNMSIPGETIDYGPCAFLNTYDPLTVFSSIDEQGRYAFGNQSKMTHWNLIALANAILPLVSEDQEEAIKLAQSTLEKFSGIFKERWYKMMFSKLGISQFNEDDKKIVDDLLSLMKRHKADYTQTFVALMENKESMCDWFENDEFIVWKKDWQLMANLPENKENSAQLMRSSNPLIIPRNHWVENVLQAAVAGDINPFNDLLDLLKHPYNDIPDEFKYQNVPLDFDNQYQTFCGT